MRRLWPQCGGYAGHFHESPPSVQRRDVFTPGAAHFVISARGCSVPVWSRSSHSLRDVHIHQILYCVTVVATSEAGGLAGCLRWTPPTDRKHGHFDLEAVYRALPAPKSAAARGAPNAASDAALVPAGAVVYQGPGH